LTYTGAKQLVPLANKPVLFYVLEDLVAAGVTDIGIVVGDTAAQIEAAVGDGSAFGCSVTYLRQDRPAGLAHAVITARDFLGDSPFVMYLGDNFIQGGIGEHARAFLAGDAAAYLLLYRVQNPQDFGVAEIEGGRVVRLEEKPRVPMSDLALVGIYFFRAEIHAATLEIKPSWRGELEITDAIQRLVDSGLPVRPQVLSGWWIDTGKMEDMLDANRFVLQDIARRVDGTIGKGTILQGNVVVEAGAIVTHSTLRGPLIIGADTRIENSYIGPFSAIGPNCVVRGSEIEHTIIMERSQVLDVPYRIEDSLIGRDVTIEHAPPKPKAYRLMLGDHSKVGIP
jgi:glucose-1-phosphate thymidylyltransferase